MGLSPHRPIRAIGFATLWFVLMSGVVCLQAQQGGAALGGTVLDASGKIFPNAVVKIKNESSDYVRMVITDGEGRFSAAGLPAGTYTIEASAPGFVTTVRTGQHPGTGGADNIALYLSVAGMSDTVTVEAVVSTAADLAPSGNTLDARSAATIISAPFIQNFTSPVSDYVEVLNMAPGTFGVNPNGIGLGDSKIFFRGFQDGLYTMTYDGIPFEDTNTPTHHSWVFFPGQWIGGVNFDRSPGTASTIGPTNFGGSVNLLSREVRPDPDIRASISYGSFNTRMLDLGIDSGMFGFGKAKKSNLLIDVHQLLSDGYQTYNHQKRIAGSGKYQYQVTPNTTITLFTGIVDLWTNTPNTKGPTRAQVDQFGPNYLMTGDPSMPNYYGYNFYHVQSEFSYIGVTSNLGHGWRLDNKTYQYRYWNKQNYNGTTITATSGVDKLNGYNKFGDVLSAVKDLKWGTFRTGVWYEWAYTDRYQIPSDPRTWVNTPFGNFHEHFITQSWQPFAEYEFRATSRLSITAGVKYAQYNMHLNQFADNGKTIGCPGGKIVSSVCVGGVAFVTHDGIYHSWLPSIDARYRLKRNWTAYAQFGEGSVVPPSSVFDVKNAEVSVLPRPTMAKTYQMGSVLKFSRWTLDLDAYYIHFQNPYVSTPDPNNGNEPIYYLPGPSNTKGVEVESNFVVGHGLSLYLNGTMGAAKYQNTSWWVASAPRNTATVGVSYQRKSWDLGFFNKRIGSMWNDNGGRNQAIPIDAFNVTNAFINYTMKDRSLFRGSKLALSVNNLFDQHSIYGVTAATAATAGVAYAQSPNDQLLMLPGRSVMLTLTAGFAPRR